MFHRIRGAGWYRNPEHEWKRLLAALEGRGIEPKAQSAEPPVRTGLAEAVRARADELVAAWVRAEVTPTDRVVEAPPEPEVRAVSSAPRPLPVEPPSRVVSMPIAPSVEPLPVRVERSAAPYLPLEPPRIQSSAGARERLVRDHLGADWVSKSEVLGQLPVSLTDGERVATVRALVEQGVAEHCGEKRGRQYRLAQPAARSIPRDESTREASEPGAGSQAPSRSVTSSSVPSGDPVKSALVRIDPTRQAAPCPSCDRAMVLFVGKNGPFTKCQVADCDGREEVPEATLKTALAAHPEWRCGTCEGGLRLKPVPKGSRVCCALGHEETWKDMRDRVGAR